MHVWTCACEKSPFLRSKTMSFAIKANTKKNELHHYRCSAAVQTKFAFPAQNFVPSWREFCAELGHWDVRSGRTGLRPYCHIACDYDRRVHFVVHIRKGVAHIRLKNKISISRGTLWTMALNGESESGVCLVPDAAVRERQKQDFGHKQDLPPNSP